MTVKIGKEAFYRQIEMKLSRGLSTIAAEVMIENMMARRRGRHRRLHREARPHIGKTADDGDFAFGCRG